MLFDLDQAADDDPRASLRSGAPNKKKELAMTKKAALATIAILLTATPLAFAAETSSTVGMRQPSAADLNSLTDIRIGIVKSALQLTADQEKY
jgi:hypothetical protein